MTSPTPSVDSLSGLNPMGTFVDQSDSGLVLDFACRESSSSSSTCSSIVFPHLSLSGSNLGSLGNNGYCDQRNGHRSDYHTGSSNNSGSSNGLPSPTISGLKCGICHDSFIQPKVLPCLHTFCQDCLEKSLDGDRLLCPSCRQECAVGPQGVKGLLTDYAVASIIVGGSGSSSAVGSADSKKQVFEMENNNNESLNRNLMQQQQQEKKAYCTGCKTGDPVAVTDNEDSPNYLCSNCYLARVYMKCLEKAQNKQIGKQFGEFGDVDSQNQVVSCTQHKGEPLQYFCKTCVVPVCTECLMQDHSKPNHDCEALATCEAKYVKQLSQFIHDFRMKSVGLHDVLKSFEAASSTLQSRYMKAQTDVSDAFNYYRALLDERKGELLKDLETLYSSRQLTLNMVTRRVEETLNRMYQTVEFGDRLLRHASPPQILVFKKLLETRLHALLAAVPEPTLSVTVAASGDLEFIGNYASIQSALRNNLGYIRSGVNADNAAQVAQQQPAPIARPIGTQPNKMGSGMSNGNSALETSMLSKRLANTGISGNNLDIGGLRSYETWSNGSTETSFPAPKDYSDGLNQLSSSMQINRDPLSDFSSKLITPSVFQKSSTIKRQKMTYHYKFGEYGTAEAQFTEPSGVAVNANNEIIVADTNNHRIQIFDREGRFKFQFGECGKRDGQLLYPNRVAVVKHTGDIVVTERSPTHQIQIYNQYGQFVRKFGANILQHPRGITVDNQGRVIVVECKVMRVIIFDQMGTVLHKFGCSKHLEFPNGVVVNDRQEIFISDNRAHCVKVFSYEGVFLRQIGGEGLTNYPIGVGINSNGDILVADNHNNFNLTAFTQDGQLVSALESKVKHAQCFDVALMDDGSVVLASKDYRLYIYKYI